MIPCVVPSTAAAERLPCRILRIPKPAHRKRAARIFAAGPGGFALESAAAGGKFGRWSIYGCEPVRSVSIPFETDPFAVLAAELRPGRRYDRPVALPFIGGWVGYLAYESGKWCEPRGDSGRWMRPFLPARWALYDAVIVEDRAEDAWYAAGVAPDGLMGRLERRLEELARRVAGRWRGRGEPAGDLCGEVTCEATPDEYRLMVRRALEYIAAGDVFQVNLARRFRAPFEGSPVELYERLRRANPATFAACLPYEDGTAVVSASPELFLDVRAGRVTTRPIKGTRPRTGDARQDARAARELMRSPKDRAELAMIVDLERNDLGRVCRYGSVRVDREGELERCATVQHRVATIRGILRPDCDAIDLLRATYPGGSVTGAPKVRAMQIIAELEREPRGPYCGAIGMIGLNGDARLNLAIRTIALAAGAATIRAGGGIVADSDPQAEYGEVLVKASGMMRAVGADSVKPAPGGPPRRKGSCARPIESAATR